MTGNGLFISVDSTHSQAMLLQPAVSDDDPLQSLPNPARAGKLQVRVLDFVPESHDLVQEEYSPHSLHWPLTVYFKMKYERS